MAVRKPYRSKGCRTSPRCDHPWSLDVMHKGVRYRMPVDDFAFARGAKAQIRFQAGSRKNLGAAVHRGDCSRQGSADRLRW